MNVLIVATRLKKKNLRQHIARLTDCLERLKQMKDDVEESKYQLEYEHSNAKGRINELIVVVENSDSEIEQLKVENEVLRSKAIESLILHNINYQT
jgi:DNA-binding protein YbaB